MRRYAPYLIAIAFVAGVGLSWAFQSEDKFWTAFAAIATFVATIAACWYMNGQNEIMETQNEILNVQSDIQKEQIAIDLFDKRLAVYEQLTVGVFEVIDFRQMLMETLSIKLTFII